MTFFGEECHIQSLARGLSVIRSFRPGRERLTMAEVASACQMSRAGAGRILMTLQELGYVALEGRHFFLTSRVLELSERFLEQALWETAKPVLQGVVDRLNETASIGVLEGFDLVYTLRIRSARPLHLEPQSGPAPPHSGSIGRVLLSALTPSQLRRYFAQAKFMRYTPSTVCDPDTLCKLLDQVRAQGWCHVLGEVDEAVSGVAVPLKDGEGRTFAALSIGTTRERASTEYVEGTIVPVLQRAAETIARAL